MVRSPRTAPKQGGQLLKAAPCIFLLVLFAIGTNPAPRVNAFQYSGAAGNGFQ